MESLPRLLFQSAERRAGHTALQDERAGLTYAELAARVQAQARHMLALGLRNQARVAVFMDKSVEACALVLAAMHAGAIAVPLNPKLKPQQVRYILADCSAQLLFTTTARRHELRHELQDLDLQVLCTDAPGAHGGMQDGADGAPAPYRRIDADPAALLYTSGSTGQPKGVVVSHRNLVAGCRSVNQYLGTREDDVVLALLPISFDAGLSQVSTGLAAGARVVLHTPLLPQATARLVAEQRVTMITAVPPMWSLLTQAQWNTVDTRSVRLFANTGGHMGTGLLARLRGMFPAARPFLMYGLTEAFRSTYLDPAEVERRPGSIGKAIPDAEILVLRADGSECAPDEPGELVHRGALVTLGYWNAPHLTAERFRALPGSGLCTGRTPEYAVWSGDLVKRDAEGFLYFVGRRDELIKSSGYRISPTELESLIGALQGVQEVAVFGVPAGDIGDAIYAALVPTDAGTDRAVLRARLEAQCRSELPSYMVPRLLLLDELPRSPNGKLDRPALKGLCQQAHQEVQA
jgi:acyl-CoA ligase (AMP-forming) (exosortase A-associated)